MSRQRGRIVINRGQPWESRAGVAEMAAGFFADVSDLNLVRYGVRIAGDHVVFCGPVPLQDPRAAALVSLGTPAYAWGMDGDEARFLPAALVMVFSGQAAAMLALVAVASGDPLAPIAGVIAASLLLAGYGVSPSRRWSVRLGSIVAPLGVPIWLVVLLGMDRYDDPSITLLCAAMAGASWWAATFLREELRPPEWLRASDTERDEPAPMNGWIEELPVTEFAWRP